MFMYFFLISLLCVIARFGLCCKYFVNPYVDKQFDFFWSGFRTSPNITCHETAFPSARSHCLECRYGTTARFGGCAGVTLCDCELCWSHIPGPDVRRMIVGHRWNGN